LAWSYDQAAGTLPSVSRWAAAERKLRARFAGNVRRIRGEHALTLEEAAHRAEMHWRHLQKLEAGETSPTLRTLARLAAALEVEPRDLL
jgi:DNA-binding Xre family transcriptional regulator